MWKWTRDNRQFHPGLLSKLISFSGISSIDLKIGTMMLDASPHSPSRPIFFKSPRGCCGLSSLSLYRFSSHSIGRIQLNFGRTIQDCPYNRSELSSSILSQGRSGRANWSFSAFSNFSRRGFRWYSFKISNYWPSELIWKLYQPATRERWRPTRLAWFLLWINGTS